MKTEEINRRIARWLFDLMVKERGLKPRKRTASEMLHSGRDSKGLWIYMDPKGIPKGMNYGSKRELEGGEFEKFTKQKNFHNDLNAIAEAEGKLFHDQLQKYLSILGDICSPEPTSKRGKARNAITATAPQRCEALLRTIGQWGEKE